MSEIRIKCSRVCDAHGTVLSKRSTTAKDVNLHDDGDSSQRNDRSTLLEQLRESETRQIDRVTTRTEIRCPARSLYFKETLSNSYFWNPFALDLFEARNRYHKIDLEQQSALAARIRAGGRRSHAAQAQAQAPSPHHSIIVPSSAQWAATTTA